MKIAIAGYGTEGKANYNYWNSPEHEVVIVDERSIDDVPVGANVITGEGAFGRLEGFDLVIRTAGLSPHKIKTDGKVWSATNEFFEKCPAPIIGVTGTKGKGTTSSLITSILRAAGKTVHLVGNIGVPALEKLSEMTADDIVVYELSSFQLWDAKRSPHVAVVLKIEPDHLDVHDEFEDYVAAKANIATYQMTTDRIIYNNDNEWAVQIAEQSVGQRLPYPSERMIHVRGDYFYYQDSEICAVENLQLPGAHNIENACAAIAAAWSWVQDGSVIAEGLRGFDGLPHRLKLVREYEGVKYYDDSISTTPGSAIAAIRSFSTPKILILGGSSKGADFHELAECVKNGSVKTVIVMGEEASRIEEALRQVQYEGEIIEGNESMRAVVAAAGCSATAGDIVILSPACASFGLFENYVDRGEQFVAEVMALTS